MNSQIDWGLNEPLRFPRRAEGWNHVDQPIVIRNALKISSSPDAVAFASSRSQLALVLVAGLVEEKEQDFGRASCSLPPEAWRLLFYRTTYCLDAFCVVAFNAESAFRDQCYETDDFEDPPSSWLGDDVSIDGIAADAEVRMRELGYAGCNAAWAILSVAQLLGLSRSEVLQCEWWNPKWVSQLTRHVRFVP